MPVHSSPCLVCGKITDCCNDTHILGVTIYNTNGCESQPYSIGEFCSLGCFALLKLRMEDRESIARREFPEWFSVVKEGA